MLGTAQRRVTLKYGHHASIALEGKWATKMLSDRETEKQYCFCYSNDFLFRAQAKCVWNIFLLFVGHRLTACSAEGDLKIWSPSRAFEGKWATIMLSVRVTEKQYCFCFITDFLYRIQAKCVWNNSFYSCP